MDTFPGERAHDDDACFRTGFRRSSIRKAPHERKFTEDRAVCPLVKYKVYEQKNITRIHCTRAIISETESSHFCARQSSPAFFFLRYKIDSTASVLATNLESFLFFVWG